MSCCGFYIRKANQDDRFLLAGLIRESFKTVALRFGLNNENCNKHPSNCTDQWIKNDIGRGVSYYLLETKDAAVGCVALEKADETLGYMERLAVLPQHRKNGYGKALVRHVLEEATSMGLKRIGIGIIAEDKPLKQWYRKLDFVSQERKSFPHLPFTVEFMVQELGKH